MNLEKKENYKDSSQLCNEHLANLSYLASPDNTSNQQLHNNHSSSVKTPKFNMQSEQHKAIQEYIQDSVKQNVENSQLNNTCSKKLLNTILCIILSISIAGFVLQAINIGINYETMNSKEKQDNIGILLGITGLVLLFLIIKAVQKKEIAKDKENTENKKVDSIKNMQNLDNCLNIKVQDSVFLNNIFYDVLEQKNTKQQQSIKQLSSMRNLQ